MSESLRYNRQKIIEKWDQSKLTESKIIVVGAGALGNYVCAGLIGLGIGNIEIYDFDEIEIHNLNRQSLFTEEDIGKNKADILKDRLTERNSEVNIQGFNEKITEKNISTLFNDANVIIDAVDNLETRSIISRFCLIKNIPLIHGATSSDGGQIATITRETPCIECFMNTEKEDTDDQSCTNVADPSVVYSTQIISGLMIECVRISILPLNDNEKPIVPILYYDMNSPGRFYHVKLKRKPDCVCNQILKKIE
jgi:molybdopterin/thiamine biosynthesis adenylyltransferase